MDGGDSIERRTRAPAHHFPFLPHYLFVDHITSDNPAASHQPSPRMLLSQVISLLAIATGVACDNDRPVSVKLPLDAETEELLRERPLSFQPAEGQHLRRDFEKKHGYRGERLIAKLGTGPTPLTIYDSSLNKPTPSSSSSPASTVVSASPRQLQQTQPSTTTDPSPAIQSRFKSNKGHVLSVPTTTKRKYVHISRQKKERKHGYKNTGRTSRKLVTPEPIADGEPTPFAPEINPSEEAAVQRRLYRAIWNHGLRGLTDSEKITENLVNLGTLAPPNFSNLDLMQQLAGAINLSNQQTFTLTPSQPSENGGGVPGDGHVLHALAQSATADTQAAEDGQQEQPGVIEGAEPSLQQYAGVGEPSLLVASYSYSEIGEKPGFGNSQTTVAETSDQQQQLGVGDQQQPTGEQQQIFGDLGQQQAFGPPIAELDDDPLGGGTELKPQIVKP